MDLISYALSKKIAASAVSGVQSMSVSGQTLTINTKDSGVLTMTFPKPRDGVSVTDIDVNANNQIVFTMSDGSEIISGKIPTVKGDKGDPFTYSDFTPEQLESLKGEDGFSPTATVEKVGKVATITITDKNGTTTATIKDGEGSEGGEANTIDSISVNGVNVSPDSNKNVDITVPSKTSDLSNDSGYLTEHQDISGKVDKVDGKSLIADTEIARLASVDNYDDTQVKSQIQAVANGLMDSVGYSADYKTIDIIAKNGVKKSVNVAPIISHASITELSDVDTTNKATGKALVYNATTSKHEYADVSGTDEKVKMDASTDAKYLGELLDNITIANENGELKVKKLDGQEVTITEINYLKGLTMNVMDLVNMFSNGGVKIINTPVATYAELLTLDKSAFIEGISYLVYVLADENHDNAKTTYLVDKDSETPTYFGFADSQRDFTTNPIDLATEITGKLGISNMDSDAIKALFTVDDTYKTETATNNAFSTHGAKALYDELLLAIGNKANNSDLTNHKDDTGIHVSTTEKDNWNGKADASDLTAHTDDADIHVTTDDKTAWNKVTDKVDKIEGKGLSTNDYTNEEKALVATIGDKVDKSSIVTVLDDTATDEQVASALLTKTELDKISTAQQEEFDKVNNNLTELKSSDVAVGKNLFNMNDIVNWEVSTPDRFRKKIFHLKPNTAYTISMDKYPISTLYFGDDMSIKEPKTITTDSTGNVKVEVNINTIYDCKVQLEAGDTNTVYEPYIPSVKMLAEENAQQSSDLDGLGYGENSAKNLFKDYDVMQSYTISSETYNGYPVIYSDQQWEGAYQSDLILKSGVTYTISAYVKGNGYAYIFSSSKGGYIGGKKIALTDNFKRFSLVYTPNEDASQIRIENEGSGLYIACFQIEEGYTATPYKPYIPSVKMLAEEVNAQNDSLSVIGKCKNLLNPTLQTTTRNGVTCTNNGDGTYTLNGTATSQASFEVVTNFSLEKGKKYKMLGCPNGGSVSTYLMQYKFSAEQSPIFDTGNGKDFLEIDSWEQDNIWIVAQSGVTFSNIVFKPMITEDLTVTYDDFVPYTGDGKTLASDVAEIKNDLAPKKIELQNVDERVTIQDNGSFIINGFAFVNLLVTFNETIEQWTNFVRLPRPKVDRISVHCENSVKLTIYNQDNLPGDCGTNDIVQSGTEIRLLVNYEVA